MIGLAIAILASSVISTVVSTQWVAIQGPKGDKGDAGPQGEQGSIGPQGAQGPQGIQGEKGDKGDIGPQGLQGSEGPQGPQGQQGIQGPPGVFTIENMSGWLPAPAYDSGWVSVDIHNYSGPNIFKHGLNTTDVLVYTHRNCSLWIGVHSNFFYSDARIRWCNLTKNEIWVYINEIQPDLQYDEIRIMMWKIAET